MPFLVAAVAFLIVWLLNGSLLRFPSIVSQIALALTLACAFAFVWQQARRRKTPPDS
jgi:hypothetical protein